MIRTALAVFLLVPLMAKAQQQLPPDVTVHRDVEYAKSPQKALLLDLYLPKSEKPTPLVVWVHGGAWRGGSKANPPALPLLRDGYAVASISYRLSQDAVFPAQIHDCKAAIRYLRANAKRHNIDAERIGVWGSSAGGHLVALLGAAGDVKELEGDLGEHDDVSSRVRCVVDFFGPTDFLKMGKNAQDHDAPDSPESRLIGGPIQQNPEKVARANPITYVTPDDPPFLILHGDQDNLVPLNQSELLRDALRKANVPVTFKVMEGMGHGFRGPEPLRMVREFFEKHLKG